MDETLAQVVVRQVPESSMVADNHGTMPVVCEMEVGRIPGKKVTP